MRFTGKQIAHFQSFIFTWWEKNKRDLPWRRTNDPYKILVSEVMLQQTQVLRVIPKYAEFIEACPTVEVLARTAPAQVLRLWKGMGYNRRALYLQKAAKIIFEKHKGEFSRSEKELAKLPGVGTYTARAILVFAFKQPVTLIDTNIRKIITHFFFSDRLQKERIIEDVSRQLLPQGKSWEWHQALMDYGALRLSLDVARDRSGQARNTHNKIPFRESNRFYRGRIVDRLRESDIKETQLLKELIAKHKKSKSLLKKIIEGLEHDGLIARTNENMLRLPT